jgi:hypothetical protein
MAGPNFNPASSPVGRTSAPFAVVLEAEPVGLDVGTGRHVWACLSRSRLRRVWVSQFGGRTSAGVWVFDGDIESHDEAFARRVHRDRIGLEPDTRGRPMGFTDADE